MKTFLTFLLLNFYCYSLTWAQPLLDLEEYAAGFSFPVDITHANDDRLFIIERRGVVRIIDGNGTVLPTPFLDIAEQVEHFNSASGEIGLLGIAFHPDYVNNGYFYLNYINNDFNTTVSRFQVSAGDPNVANPDSELEILNVTQPFLNHNGGCLQFGPDGYLYIGMGDGGSGGDPMALSQDRTSLLGKMLRIDVDNGNPYSIPADNPFVDDDFTLDEIWSIGLRNPWRFSFDRGTGDLWIGDVGQSVYEEIDFEASNSPGGLNYGWRCYEGPQVFNDDNCEDPSNFTLPVEAYPHTGHCSVTGGYLYRGNDFPSLQGYYLYADYCSGQFWSIFHDGVGNFEVNEAGSFGGFFASTFGEDQNGEMYVAHLTEGKIYKVGLEVCSEFIVNTIVTPETCTGDNDGLIELFAENGQAPYDYVWSTGATTDMLGSLTAGTYSVTVSDGQNCERTLSIEVENNEVDNYFITADGATNFCAGNQVVLTASQVPGEYTYQWFEGNNLLMGQTGETLTVDSSGAYYVTLIGPCEVNNTSNWINVEVEPVPSPFIEASGGSSFCAGEMVLLNLVGTSLDGYTTQWYNNGMLIEGATTNEFSVAEEGNYYVIQTSDLCESPQSNWIFVDSGSPSLGTNGSPTLCFETELNLMEIDVFDINGTAGTFTYHSASPANENNLLSDLDVVLTDTFTYYVLSTAGECTDELAVTIDVYPMLTPPTITGDFTFLSVPDIYASYQWYYIGDPIEGETAATHIPGINGAYSVLVTDGNGCSTFSNLFEVSVSNRDISDQLAVQLLSNPFNEQITLVLESTKAQQLTLQLVDVLGRKLKTQTLQINGTLTVNFETEDLTSGLYFLVIENGEGQLVEKLVKE